MALNTGTLDVSALLAEENISVLDYGLEPIQQAFEAELAVHNRIMTEMISEIAVVTTERATTYGGASAGEMVEVDEYGRAPTQRPGASSTVGFPLRAFQFNVGWTRKWFQNHTPADMARALDNAMTAHRKAVQREVKRAIFRASNYTFYDHLVDNATIAVKRFINADSAVIPAGPNGEAFTASSHTHYDAVDFSSADAAAENAAVLALINDVVEHGHGGAVRLYINTAQETAVRALASFTPYLDPRVSVNTGANQATGSRLDITRLDNRAIGIFGAAEVWVKPWVPASYMFAFDAGDARKPLAFRQRAGTTQAGLQVIGENVAVPLTAEFMEAEFGVGVLTRTNGAVLYIGSGTYADPTIN